MSSQMNLRAPSARLVPLLAALLPAACGGGSEESDAFVIRNTNVAAFGATPVVISGARIAFLAAEDQTGTAGTDLNGDGVPNDTVAHVVNTATNREFRLGIAAQALAWVGSDLYLVVDEALDGRDYDGVMGEDHRVLLHWSEASPTATFLERLSDDATPILGLGSRLLYAGQDAGLLPGDSNLRFVESSAPTVGVPVPTTDTVGPLRARILGSEAGLVFLAYDETLAMRSLNGDADDDDERVLALLDGTIGTGVVRNTGLAVDEDSPLRAKALTAGDWHVAFLVNEFDQGGVSRNSSAVGANFRPTHCTTDDTDDDDNVLCLLRFAAWNADPVASPPVNHGLAGRDRIAIAGSYVATIVLESDDGPCNLNNDTPADTTDRVVRWVRIASSPLDPILPANDAANIHALAAVPGGSHGLVEFGSRFVVVVSEADDGSIDTNDALDSNLVGWLTPTTTPGPWSFFHGSLGATPVATSWMAPSVIDGRLGVALEERLGGTSLNAGQPENPGDTDLNDSVPTFALFSNNRMIFPGVTIAVDRDSAGITFGRGFGFYRVSEPEDSRNWNGDSDESDFVLFRTNLADGRSFGMGATDELPRLVIDRSGQSTPACAAFLAREAAQGAGGTDFNGDTDRTDVVLRWFRF